MIRFDSANFFSSLLKRDLRPKLQPAFYGIFLLNLVRKSFVLFSAVSQSYKVTEFLIW